MSKILYGYYFNRYKPWICQSVKRIVSDSFSGLQETIYSDDPKDVAVADFEHMFTDINGVEWIMVGIIEDIEGKKGEG